MAEAHPIELRKRVVEAYESGEGTYEEVAAQFHVGPASVNRWVRLQRTRGSVVPQRKRGGTPSTIAPEELAALLEHMRDPTVNELTELYNRGKRGSDRVHASSIKRALHRNGYVVKKNADGLWRFSVLT
jgi:transposase